MTEYSFCVSGFSNFAKKFPIKQWGMLIVSKVSHKLGNVSGFDHPIWKDLGYIFLFCYMVNLEKIKHGNNLKLQRDYVRWGFYWQLQV